MGAELRDDRGAPLGPPRVQTDIQRAVDAGEIRLSKPRPGATRPRRAGRGRVDANTVKPLSKNPGAVQRDIPLFNGSRVLIHNWSPDPRVAERKDVACGTVSHYVPDQKISLIARNGLAQVMAEMRKLDVTGADVPQALEILTAQGKDASFTLKDLAAQGERLYSAFARLEGIRGVEGVRYLGAVTQVARQATGGPEQAATAVAGHQHRIGASRARAPSRPHRAPRPASHATANRPVDLITSVDGSPSAVLTRQWKLLRITLGVGYAQDTASLTLTAAGIVLPRDAVSIQFAVDGVDLGSFNVTRMRGDTRTGSVTILATAIDPTSTLHQPRNRAWAGQSIDAMVDAIASEAGLEASVAPDIGRRILAARLQRSESDLAFLQRTIANLEGRVLIQEGRLIVTMGDTPVVPPPTLSIDLKTTGAWVAWERQWSEPLFVAESFVRLIPARAGNSSHA